MLANLLQNIYMDIYINSSLNISTDVSINSLTNFSEHRATKAWREVEREFERRDFATRGKPA